MCGQAKGRTEEGREQPWEPVSVSQGGGLRTPCVLEEQFPGAQAGSVQLSEASTGCFHRVLRTALQSPEGPL